MKHRNEQQSATHISRQLDGKILKDGANGTCACSSNSSLLHEDGVAALQYTAGRESAMPAAVGSLQGFVHSQKPLLDPWKTDQESAGHVCNGWETLLDAAAASACGNS
jgi:hypothetical protein